MSQERRISSRRGWCWGAWLLLLGCTAPVESGRVREVPLLRGVAQRVTATVRREALRFVRLETERESLLTTPEHPFATPGSGWIRAGRLVPGEGVVSERFGAVRLLSVRGEVAAQPVPVFNLSVASSHAYFVGADRVLVHNTKCEPDASEAREQEIERLSRQRTEIKAEITALTKTTPESPRLAALERQRNKLTYKIRRLRWAQRRAQEAPLWSRDERALQSFRVDHESARKALEAVQQELAELESRPTSAAEKLGRKRKLEKQILAFQLSYERTSRIVAWLGELAELDEDIPATDAARRALEVRQEALRENLRLERRRQTTAKRMREWRAARAGLEESAPYEPNQTSRRLRTASYVADTERPRDRLELLEEELSRQLQEGPSESRDARISHVTERIETMKRLVELRREIRKFRQRRARARSRREQLIAQGKDASESGRKLEQAARDFQAVRIELTRLRVREGLLARLGGTPWADAPGSVDEARLREFERQLVEGLGDERALAGIERALDAMEPPHADREAVRAEAEEVDAVLSEREELMREGASPERAVGFEASYERLERELREERVAVEGAVSALVNESAHIQTTQASSSRGPSWQERLRRIREEQEGLLAHWRTGLRARVDSARGQLHLLRSIERFRDEDVEAELERQIALLERELKRAG